jgi:4-hydroxy-2-oxoheptanedioate aldolase
MYGNPGHPEVQQVIEDAIRTIIACGKAAGTLMPDNALARRYLALGCTFVAVGTDTRLLAGSSRGRYAQFAGSAREEGRTLERAPAS